MNRKLALLCLILIVTVAASSQRRPGPAAKAAKPLAARLLVQGIYEESFQGTTNDGSAQSKLLIKFEAARWLTMGTNEVGNAEFSDLENAPAPYVSGTVSYQGRVKGLRNGGETYEATSSFAGPLAGEDIVLSNPEYTDSGKDFKLKVVINPKLKGKCFAVVGRGGQTGTSTGCRNGTLFISASSPLQIDDNEEPTKTPDTANLASFGIELNVEPEAAAATEDSSPVDEAARARGEPAKTMGQGPTGDAGVYAWRGAVTSGSKETGFKITLTKTKELPSEDKSGKSVRLLTFTATIVPGVPK